MPKTAATTTAYIGQSLHGSRWKLQLIGFHSYREISDIHAEVDIPAGDELLLALAEEFFEAIVAAKGMVMRARRGNDE